jgi:hypothetical protein
MTVQPKIIERAEQPYAATRALVAMQTFDQVVPALHPEVRG